MWPFLLGSLYHLAEKNRINTIFLVEDVVGNAIEEFLVFSCICRFVCDELSENIWLMGSKMEWRINLQILE